MKQALKKLLSLIPKDESGLETQDSFYTSAPLTLLSRTNINVCACYNFPGNITAAQYSAWLTLKYPLSGKEVILADIRKDFRELVKLNTGLEYLLTTGYDIEMMRHIMWGAAALFQPDDISWLAVGSMNINNIMYERPGYADLFLRLNDGLEEYGGLCWLPHPSTLLLIYEEAKKLGLIDNPYIDSYAASLNRKEELEEN